MYKPKFVVIKLKELLLTAAIVLAAVALTVLIITLVALGKESTPKLPGVSENPGSTETLAPLYYPGVYTTTMEMNDTTIHLELVCDENHINSVRLIN